MRILKRILAIVAVIAVALVAIAYLLPREVEVSRSTTIAADPATVFARIDTFEKQMSWSPWAEIDPEMTSQVSGPARGIGHTYVWTSDHPNVGSGRQEVIGFKENSEIISALDFGDMGTAEAALRLKATGTGTSSATEVTWTLKADMGMNPIGRWMGLMMDGMVGADYEKGLATLKETTEGS
jgi:hypothetical protein